MRIISKHDAIEAYIEAAMDVSEEWPVRPSSADVEETEPGVFRINSPEPHDDQAQSLPALATCTYNEAAQEWIVQFPDDQVVKLRDVDGELSVVTE